MLKSALSMLLVGCFLAFANGQEKELPFNTNVLGTFSNPQARKALNLVDEQNEVIDSLLDEFRTGRDSIGRELREEAESIPKEEHGKLWEEYRTRVAEVRLDVASKIKDTLLPEQVKRLEQLAAQRMLREGESKETGGLLSRQMVDYLELSSKQQDAIKDKSEELRRKVMKQIEKIVEEARQELLEELDDDQRERYTDLVGEPLTSKEEDEDQRKETERRERRRKNDF